jgi:acyl carrier protein
MRGKTKEGGKMTKEEIFDQVKRELEFIYDSEDVTSKTNFVDDLGMDSLDMLELMSDMEEKFEINTDDFDEKPLTVGELVEEIWQRKHVRVMN